jgi:hypothetical protein
VPPSSNLGHRRGIPLRQGDGDTACYLWALRQNPTGQATTSYQTQEES